MSLQAASYGRTLNFHLELSVCSLCDQKLHFAARSVCTSLVCTPQVPCLHAADLACKRRVRRTVLQQIFCFYFLVFSVSKLQNIYVTENSVYVNCIKNMYFFGGLSFLV